MDPAGLPIGGWGLYLTPRDMAKLGYLYLKNGQWEDRQVVPASWVLAATSSQTKTDEEMDYGYQWWIYPPLEAFAARGRGGQLIFVIPDMDLVIVFTAGMEGDSEEIRLIEEFILPALIS